MARLLPLFPLSTVVLFPRVRVPLHVFEPRYREMTRSALEGDRRLGMATVLPEHADDLSGDPPLFRVGCEGVIEEAQRLPDGRYHLVVLGTRRFRILDEPARPPSRGYRVAEVEALGEEPPSCDAAAMGRRRAELLHLLLRLVRRLAPERTRELASQSFEGVDDETFVNALAQAVDLPPPEKQSLLEAGGPQTRCDQLATLLHFRLASIEGGGSASVN